jgi:iron complex outermembrane receptor protein
MSELIKTSAHREFRWTLLTTVSALALAGAVYAGDAKANDDSDHPVIWIELGGQFTQLNTPGEKFAPPFILATPRPGPETISPLGVPHPPRVSIDGDAKISFQPENSDWIFSAAVRIGRSNAKQHVHQQTYPTHPTGFTCSTGCQPKYQRALQFMDTAANESESHAIVDFAAGKDLGIGMFGGQTSSVFSFGLRFAQFRAQSNIAFKSDPDAKVHIVTYGNYKFRSGATYHSNAATSSASRSFQGLGPSISWNNSTRVAGHETRGLALDWGVNAAILFGRQKARVHHQTTARYHKGKYYISSRPNYRYTQSRNTPPDQIRSRTVIVPNMGGFAALSYRFGDAKLNVGYRADFFFGAMDGGIDTHKSENVGFYGPFASISVGLGG